MRRQIAMISEHASPLSRLGGADFGGQNLYVGQVAKALAGLGYEVDVFTRRDSPILPETADWVDGVRIIHVPAGPPTFVRKEDLLPYMDEFAAFTIKFARSQRTAYDLAHANFWMSGLVAAELKRALGLPFVVTFHALGRVRREHQREADQFPDARFEIEDRIVREADHIVAEAPQDEEDLLRLYHADPAKISIIPCGFDPGELWPISKALARVSLGLPPEERVILYVGRMVPRKGIDTVIRGFAGLRREHHVEARLLVIGGESEEPDPRVTPEIGRLQAVAAEAQVADRVVFLGQRGRDQLKYYYSAADVFVTTPWYEPFGITPVEAMACGTPVIGSNVGGIKFTVRDGETGYLVPANQPQALADRLAHLYANPRLLALFGRQAIDRANSLFTWQKVAAALSTRYEQVALVGQPHHRRVPEQLTAVDRAFDRSIELLQDSRRRLRAPVLEAAALIGDCMARGGKVLLYGQGAGLAAADYLARTLSAQERLSGRPTLPAVCLNPGPTPYDRDPEDFAARQVHTLARPEDVYVGICAETATRPFLQALKAARRQGLRAIALLGPDSAEVRRLVDVTLTVPSSHRQGVNEVHTLLIHLLSSLAEERARHLEGPRDGSREAAAGGGKVWALPRNGTPRVPRQGPEERRPLKRKPARVSA